MFIDPDGKDIKLFTITYEPEYYHEVAGEASFTTTKTSGLTNEVTIQAVQDFMDTPEGYAYVAQFANAGDVIKVGDKEYTFKEDGAFKDHDLQFNDYANMSEGSTSAIASATVSFSFYVPGLEPDWLSDVETPEVRITSSQPVEEGDLADRDILGVKVKSKINVNINMKFVAHSSRKEQGAGARNAITIGHEAFIHDASKALEALIKGNINELNNLDMGDGGKSDHDAYMDNNNGFSKFMNYLNSLRNTYGNDVKEAKKEHDESL